MEDVDHDALWRALLTGVRQRGAHALNSWVHREEAFVNLSVQYNFFQWLIEFVTIVIKNIWLARMVVLRSNA